MKIRAGAVLNRDGLTLVELMVAACLLSLVLAGGLRFFTVQHRAAIVQEDAAEAEQQMRAAMGMMTDEFMRIGSGVPPGDPGILEAEAGRIRFDANLAAAAARLSESVPAGERRLPVYYLNRSGAFRANKTLSLCRVGYCERHRLAEDGSGRSILLEGGLNRDFPTGSVLQVINRVSYEIKPETGTSRFRLIRTVDRGANAVAEGIGSMVLEYLDRKGSATERPPEIDRIRVRLTAPLPRNPGILRTIGTEVHLRN